MQNFNKIIIKFFKTFKKTRKRKIAKTLLIFLQIFLLLYNNIAIIFAQTPSVSPTAASLPTGNIPSETPAGESQPEPLATQTPAPSITPTAGPFDESGPTVTPAPIALPTTAAVQPSNSSALEPAFSPSTTPALSESSVSQNSATVNTPFKSVLLSQSDLNPKQSLSVKINNAGNKQLTTAVYRNGRKVTILVSKKQIEDAVFLKIDPPVHFTPGKYTLKISDQTGRTEEQNFLWGVLAINTNKSIYSPDEMVKLSFAVLDENGVMDCEANLTLKITTDSANTEKILSTENGLITKNPECEQKTTSNIADFTAIYKLGQKGTYNLNLSAVTKNGSYTITDTITVENNIPFVIERSEFPTRINPTGQSEVNFLLTPEKDFKGQIIEAVPDDFQIASSSANPFKWIASAVQNSQGIITGSNSPLFIRYPFEGQYPISLKFGEQLYLLDFAEKSIYEEFGLAGHDGVDFALPEGTPLLAVDDGHIILAGRGAYGVTVVIQHTWGRSYYGHLQSTGMILGQQVLKGDKIGRSGKTGLATGPHLHFGIKF